MPVNGFKTAVYGHFLYLRQGNGIAFFWSDMVKYICKKTMGGSGDADMFRQIRYFQSVVRLKSFSKAAEENFISQSAVSQQIQALERELGFPLFERRNRSFELRTCLHKHMHTSFRQILLHTALKILAVRQHACGFLPCLQQNYARKSAYILTVREVISTKICLRNALRADPIQPMKSQMRRSFL